MNSIWKQLIVGLLGGTLACSLAAGIASYVNVREEADELLDIQLEQLASAQPAQFPRQTPRSIADDPDDDFVVMAWDSAGNLLYSSPEGVRLPPVRATGFSTISAQDERWRVYRDGRHGRYVQVFQPMSVREEIAEELALQSVTPFLVLVPVLALLMGYVVFRSLGPLRWLARAVAQRSPEAMHPLQHDRLPPEISPIVASLNGLLARLGDALVAQRAFVADAAHELRSPLTALKLQLELAERAGNDSERLAALTRMHERLDRSARLVQQLLTLARQDPQVTDRVAVPVDLNEVAQQVVADHADLAEQRSIDLGYRHVENGLLVEGQPEDLRILLSNLVDNAIRYTPSGGRIDVEAFRTNGRPVLRVVDSGPGIPEAERERVFQRFYRREGTDVTGSGLGLAIVKRIAERHGASVRLENTRQTAGLVVRVVFDGLP